MKFTKMHGLGNDFIVVQGEEAAKIADPAQAARRWCRRRFGIGADGLVLLLPSRQADVFMRIYNADGSEAEMCGNALRCVARYLADRNPALREAVTVETISGVKKALLRGGGLVRVDMGEPVLESEAVPVVGPPRRAVGEEIEAGGEKFTFTAVSMGNPHCVIFLEEGREVSVPLIGPLLERHPAFPQGANVEFCRVLDGSTVEVAVWERGAGETPACGTGACAVVVAGVLQGKLQRKTAVHLPGGVLEIEWSEAGPVFMEGPAEEVFTGQVRLEM